MLQGTSLKPALEAKLKNLNDEFELLRSKTEGIPWCGRWWWDEDDGLLDFDDWLQVDAMFRSRSLQYPELGICMVPCIDMANHAPGEKSVARYDVAINGDLVLLLKEGTQLDAEDEVTIS